MAYTEADTRAKFVDPQIKASEWLVNGKEIKKRDCLNTEIDWMINESQLNDALKSRYGKLYEVVENYHISGAMMYTEQISWILQQGKEAN